MLEPLPKNPGFDQVTTDGVTRPVRRRRSIDDVTADEWTRSGAEYTRRAAEDNDKRKIAELEAENAELRADLRAALDGWRRLVNQSAA